VVRVQESFRGQLIRSTLPSSLLLQECRYSTYYCDRLSKNLAFNASKPTRRPGRKCWIISSCQSLVCTFWSNFLFFVSSTTETWDFCMIKRTWLSAYARLHRIQAYLASRWHTHDGFSPERECCNANGMLMPQNHVWEAQGVQCCLQAALGFSSWSDAGS